MKYRNWKGFEMEPKLVDAFKEAGMPNNDAYYAAGSVVDNILEPKIGWPEVGDIVFHELEDGRWWGKSVYSPDGHLLWSSNGAWWVGEEVPERTGKKIRFSELAW